MDSEIADSLDEMADRFDGLKGELIAAALLMFFGANPEAKRAALKNVMGAKVDRLLANAGERFPSIPPTRQARNQPAAKPAAPLAQTAGAKGAGRSK